MSDNIDKESGVLPFGGYEGGMLRWHKRYRDLNNKRTTRYNISNNKH
jgi:hypothetical protein